MHLATENKTNLTLQSNNLLTKGILQRKCVSCSSKTTAEGECSACADKKSNLQRKLTIGASNDPLEHEADRVADQVVGMSANSGNAKPAPSIQRASSKSDGSNVIVPASVHQVLSGVGRPIHSNLRQDMEQRFNQNFTQVRVHTGTAAEQSAEDINARAYTVGNNVVFGARQFSPNTSSGKRLLAHELAHVVQQGGNIPLRGGQTIQRDTPVAKPTSENVWGLQVTRSMCGCKVGIQDGINWANTAAATYAACDVPANSTGTDVEACFNLAHPTAVVVATTDSSGIVTLPPASTNPCERINNKATFVHEEMHRRHTEDMAKGQGGAFFAEWRKLAGTPNRLDVLRPTFPTEVAAFDSQWNDGHDWAQDEVNSYTWERRFLGNALSALNRIC